MTLLAVVAGAAGLAWLLRMFGTRSDESVSMPASELPPIGEVGDDFDDLDEDDGEVIALTSDGIAFIRAAHGVHLVPPGDTSDACAPNALGEGVDEVTLAARGARYVNPKTGGALASCRPKETMGMGDLVGIRVHRGAPDHDPWRLEGIGRDGEYRAWRFETRDAAEAAAEIVKTIVRPRRDRHGDPLPVADADFAEAERQDAMIEAELLLPDAAFDDGEEQRA